MSRTGRKRMPCASSLHRRNCVTHWSTRVIRTGYSVYYHRATHHGNYTSRCYRPSVVLWTNAAKPPTHPVDLHFFRLSCNNCYASSESCDVWLIFWIPPFISESGLIIDIEPEGIWLFHRIAGQCFRKRLHLQLLLNKTYVRSCSSDSAETN